MEIWVPGALALVGALSGVLLTNYLTRTTKQRDARRARLEEALQCVVLAIAARNFATRAGAGGKPPSVSDDDVQKVEQRIYLDNVERMFINTPGCAPRRGAARRRWHRCRRLMEGRRGVTGRPRATIRPTS